MACRAGRCQSSADSDCNRLTSSPRVAYKRAQSLGAILEAILAYFSPAIGVFPRQEGIGLCQHFTQAGQVDFLVNIP